MENIERQLKQCNDGEREEGENKNRRRYGIGDKYVIRWRRERGILSQVREKVLDNFRSQDEVKGSHIGYRQGSKIKPLILEGLRVENQ